MNKKHPSLFIVVISFFLIFSSALSYSQGTVEWPQEIVVDKGTIVIYQPQPEKLDGVYLTARAAVGLELNDAQEPLFLSLWFGTTLDTDHSNRSAILRDIVVTDIKFPIEITDKSKEKEFRSIIENELTKRELQINLDNLIATIDSIEAHKAKVEDLNTNPPIIKFINVPAVLISIDGPPQIRVNEGIKRVINTPYTIVQDPHNKYWYLNADTHSWYKTKELSGEWLIDTDTPASVQRFAPKPETSDEPQEKTNSDPKVRPKIIIASEPTELISSTGNLRFTPISDTHLLYASNTDSDVLMDVKSQHYYLLLSGRWYKNPSLEGTWAYVLSEELPEDFLNIPLSSELAHVRYAVAGTEEAKDAVLEAQLPQTATVNRKKAVLAVEYDGEPEFSRIENTELTYAINTPVPVIAYQNKYYAVDEAIWFVADTPQGEWEVATMIPAEIYKIPSSSPMYHVTFVEIYSHTPETVYVGYTQGYTNVYVYHGTVVYGTGYRYRGWYKRYYYPRVSTWGYHARYSHRVGWSFGFSYSNSPYAFHITRGSWYRGSWWGPHRYRGYRYGYRHGYRRGYYAGKYNSNRNNLYRSEHNLARTNVSARSVTRNNHSKVANNRQNNVYADRSGNVHRNHNGQWEQRTNKGWSKEKVNQVNRVNQPSTLHKQQMNRSTISTNKATTHSQNRVRRSHTINRQGTLNNSYQSRQRGNLQSRQRSTARSGGARLR